MQCKCQQPATTAEKGLRAVWHVLGNLQSALDPQASEKSRQTQTVLKAGSSSPWPDFVDFVRALLVQA